MPPRPSMEYHTFHKQRLKRNPSYDWNYLIADYVKCGKPHYAFELYDRKQKDHLIPTPHTFVALLKACRMLNDVERGEEIHKTVSLNGLLSIDPFIGSTLIDMYAKCGMLGKAQEVFDMLPFRTFVTWTVLIVGYSEHGQVEESMSCFEHMKVEGISPDYTTFLCILKACCSGGAITKGQVIHANIVEIGIEGNHVVGSSIVGMYASCGFFIEANNVFDKILNRDVVSWTALISGYIKHGHGNEAFSCLGKMRLEGLSPNNVTFICILKACGIMCDIVTGNEIHCEITEKGLLRKDTCLGNALIDMYVTCGNLVDAHQVFENLVDRDVVSWNVLMAGYLKHESYQEVLDCYEQMHLKRTPLSSISFIYFLKACGGLKAIEKGQEIHTEIEREGLGADLLLGGSLIEMYMNCGFLSKAKEVFDSLVTQDIVSWTALIAGYEKNGYCEEALASFEKMQFNGISPNSVTFVSILRACGGSDNVAKGQELYAEISRKGFIERDVTIGNALIDMYTECGLLFRACEVFNKLPSQDVVSWNMMMTGYAKYGHSDEVLDLFIKMQLEGHLPNAITYISSLKACGHIEVASYEGRQLHAMIVGDSSLKRNFDVRKLLMAMYAQCGMLSKAKQLFEMLTIQDTASWNMLIAGYVKHEHGEEALDCVKKMQQQGVAFDSATIMLNMKACSNLGSIDKLHKLHDEMMFKGVIDGGDIIGNALVDAYMKCSSFYEAKEVFDNLFHRDIVSWNTLITGYVKQGHSEECLNCFEQMQFEGASPNLVTFLSCLKACSSIGAISQGEKIYSEIARVGLCETNHSIGNALVDMYAKCGLLPQAEEVFMRLGVQDVVTWTALLAGYSQLGDYENVFHLFARMLDDGRKVNLITLNNVLNACNHAGQVEQGECYFLAMDKIYKIDQTVEQFSCMLDILSRAGQLEKAAIMIMEMPFHPDLAVWNIFLGACRKWGNVGMGKCAFGHAINIDKKDMTAYVCMRNIYADAGMQEAATRIEAMRMRNVFPEEYTMCIVD